MIRIGNLYIGIIGIFLLLLTACDPYQKLLKSSDYELKYQKAKEYYNAGKFDRAIPLLEELLTVYKGTKDVEKMYYFYAYSHLCLQDYEMASFYFKNFTEYYPKSQYTEEANYLVAYAAYKMSPEIPLDQTPTRKAMESFQFFINQYPYSTKIDQANVYITELRQKLEQKGYNSANLYLKMERYKAAMYAFQSLLNDFPDTPRKEEIIYLTIKSGYLYATHSIESKKQERYEEVLKTYYTLIDEYPNSKYLKDAERIFKNITNDKNKHVEHEKHSQEKEKL